jgi:hypothetical protein
MIGDQYREPNILQISLVTESEESVCCELANLQQIPW